jgi:4-hydroxy-tetrahydrodipicolinate synthase
MAFPCITANSTRDCVELAKCAESMGADGIMIGPPFYFRITDEELCEHFLAVAGAISIPIMIHNEPAVFKLDVTPPLMAKLNADSKGKIRLIKESTDNTQRVHEILNLCGDKVTVVVAGGGTALESLLLGAKAWMTGLINFLPAQSRKLYDLAKQGDYAAARELYYQSILPSHYLLKELRKPVQTVKYALELLGQKVGPTRPPLAPLSADGQEKVKRTLQEIGAL